MPHFVIALLKSTSASSSRRQKRYMKSENDCVAWDFSLALELLITRRSSVQIWLPQPNNPIIKSNWKGRKARSFDILSRLRVFLLPFLRTHNIVENMLRTLTIPLPIFSKGIFSSC